MPAAKSAGHITINTKEITISPEEQIVNLVSHMVSDLYIKVRAGTLVDYPDWPEVTDVMDAILRPEGKLKPNTSECLLAWLCCNWDDPRVAEAQKLRGFEDSVLKQVLDRFES